MSSRTWAGTVLLTCLAGAVAIGVFGVALAPTLFLAGAILSFLWLVFDPWLKKQRWHWNPPKSKGIAPTEPSAGVVPSVAVAVSYAPRTPLAKRELVYHTQGRRDWLITIPPPTPGPHQTLHFHAPADAIVRKDETPQIIRWGARSRMIVKGFTTAGYIVDEFNTVGEEVRVEVYFVTETSVGADLPEPRTTAVSSDPSNALAISLLDERWSSFQHKVRFLRVRYKVHNRTGSPIEIENFKLEMTGLHFGMDPDVRAERQRLKREHAPPPRVVPADGTVEGWQVVELKYGPGTGEPEYTLTIQSANGGHEYGFRRLGNPKQEITP